jgi:hypothetical protein
MDIAAHASVLIVAGLAMRVGTIPSLKLFGVALRRLTRENLPG